MVATRSEKGERRMTDDERKALVRDFVRAVIAGFGALVDPLNPTMRAATMTVSVVANDSKFRVAWADPEFRDAAWSALETERREKIARAKLSAKVGRFIGTIVARQPDHRTAGVKSFTDAQLEAMAADCGLTEEDLKQLRRKRLSKFN
jgi:hypothetical protein